MCFHIFLYVWFAAFEIEIENAYAKVDPTPIVRIDDREWCWRRSRSLIEIAKIAISISIFDIFLPARITQSLFACCVGKFRSYITEYRCIVCIIAAMCSIQCRASYCVVAGTKAPLSVLLFTFNVRLVKYAACTQRYLGQCTYGVYRVCCMLSV